MRKFSKPFLALGLLLCLGLGFFALRSAREKRAQDEALQAAESLYAAGDYAAAEKAFLSLGLPERAEACVTEQKRAALRAAEALMDAGEYLAARDAFLALGDFENAPARAKDCERLRAEKLLKEERFDEALALLQELGEEDALENARAALYDRALAATYACRMDEAIKLWNLLGDYRDGPALLQRCLRRVAAMAAGTDEPVNYAPYAGQQLAAGKLYYHRIGLVYVPDDAGPETRCMIFYPGGFDEALPNAYLTEYVNEADPPNAIMVLCYANGYYSMPEKIDDSFGVLEQAALENGVFVHDLTLCGASNGAYTACRAASQLYESIGLTNTRVLTFDAGMHWEVDQVLTPEECELAAQAGTEFVLLENGGVGMNKHAIALMVAHGCDVTVVECAAGGHYGIIYDAISYGMIDWALGKGGRPVNDNYSYHPLNRQSTYPA